MPIICSYTYEYVKWSEFRWIGTRERMDIFILFVLHIIKKVIQWSWQRQKQWVVTVVLFCFHNYALKSFFCNDILCDWKAIAMFWSLKTRLFWEKNCLLMDVISSSWTFSMKNKRSPKDLLKWFHWIELNWIELLFTIVRCELVVLLWVAIVSKTRCSVFGLTDRVVWFPSRPVYKTR